MYKTIVIHIDGKADQNDRLCPAALLANDNCTHPAGSAATGISWFDYGRNRTVLANR